MTRPCSEPSSTTSRLGRAPFVGLLLGGLNAVVTVATLALAEALTPGRWFAYAPLQDEVVPHPGFPWRYVAVMVALVVTNGAAVPLLVRRAAAQSPTSGGLRE